MLRVLVVERPGGSAGCQLSEDAQLDAKFLFHNKVLQIMGH